MNYKTVGNAYHGGTTRPSQAENQAMSDSRPQTSPFVERLLNNCNVTVGNNTNTQRFGPQSNTNRTNKLFKNMTKNLQYQITIEKSFNRFKNREQNQPNQQYNRFSIPSSVYDGRPFDSVEPESDIPMLTAQLAAIESQTNQTKKTTQILQNNINIKTNKRPAAYNNFMQKTGSQSKLSKNQGYMTSAQCQVQRLEDIYKQNGQGALIQKASVQNNWITQNAEKWCQNPGKKNALQSGNDLQYYTPVSTHTKATGMNNGSQQRDRIQQRRRQMAVYQSQSSTGSNRPSIGNWVQNGGKKQGYESQDMSHYQGGRQSIPVTQAEYTGQTPYKGQRVRKQEVAQEGITGLYLLKSTQQAQQRIAERIQQSQQIRNDYYAQMGTPISTSNYQSGSPVINRDLYDQQLKNQELLGTISTPSQNQNKYTNQNGQQNSVFDQSLAIRSRFQQNAKTGSVFQPHNTMEIGNGPSSHFGRQAQQMRNPITSPPQEQSEAYQFFNGTTSTSIGVEDEKVDAEVLQAGRAVMNQCRYNSVRSSNNQSPLGPGCQKYYDAIGKKVGDPALMIPNNLAVQNIVQSNQNMLVFVHGSKGNAQVNIAKAIVNPGGSITVRPTKRNDPLKIKAIANRIKNGESPVMEIGNTQNNKQFEVTNNEQTDTTMKEIQNCMDDINSQYTQLVKEELNQPNPILQIDHARQSKDSSIISKVLGQMGSEDQIHQDKMRGRTESPFTAFVKESEKEIKIQQSLDELEEFSNSKKENEFEPAAPLREMPKMNSVFDEGRQSPLDGFDDVKDVIYSTFNNPKPEAKEQKVVSSLKSTIMGQPLSSSSLKNSIVMQQKKPVPVNVKVSAQKIPIPPLIESPSPVIIPPNSDYDEKQSISKNKSIRSKDAMKSQNPDPQDQDNVRLTANTIQRWDNELKQMAESHNSGIKNSTETNKVEEPTIKLREVLANEETPTMSEQMEDNICQKMDLQAYDVLLIKQSSTEASSQINGNLNVQQKAQSDPVQLPKNKLSLSSTQNELKRTVVNAAESDQFNMKKTLQKKSEPLRGSKDEQLAINMQDTILQVDQIKEVEEDQIDCKTRDPLLSSSTPMFEEEKKPVDEEMMKICDSELGVIKDPLEDIENTIDAWIEEADKADEAQAQREKQEKEDVSLTQVDITSEGQEELVKTMIAQDITFNTQKVDGVEELIHELPPRGNQTQQSSSFDSKNKATGDTEEEEERINEVEEVVGDTSNEVFKLIVFRHTRKYDNTKRVVVPHVPDTYAKAFIKRSLVIHIIRYLTMLSQVDLQQICQRWYSWIIPSMNRVLILPKLKANKYLNMYQLQNCAGFGGIKVWTYTINRFNGTYTKTDTLLKQYIPARGFQHVQGPNEQFYLLGGWGQEKQVFLIRSYDFKFIQKANLLEPRQDHAVSWYGEHSVIVSGGVQAYKSVEIYDVHNKESSMLPDMHISRYTHSQCIFKSAIFVFCGMDDENKRLNSIEIFDLSPKRRNNEWELIQPSSKSFPERHIAGVMQRRNDIIIFGGYSSKGKRLSESHIMDLDQPQYIRPVISQIPYPAKFWQRPIILDWHTDTVYAVGADANMEDRLFSFDNRESRGQEEKTWNVVYQIKEGQILGEE